MDVWVSAFGIEAEERGVGAALVRVARVAVVSAVLGRVCGAWGLALVGV